MPLNRIADEMRACRECASKLTATSESVSDYRLSKYRERVFAGQKSGNILFVEACEVVRLGDEPPTPCLQAQPVGVAP
jgi:hypothetical protein